MVARNPIERRQPHRRRIAARRMAAAIAALCLFAAPATAEPRAVLELFTSQGCASCPPADALARELAADPGFVVLSLPVDYWDYLGWRDTLAHHAFGVRQRGYAAGRGDRQVYTPQIVVNGMHHVVGSDREAIEAAVAASAGPEVDLRIATTDTGVSVEIGPAQGVSGRLFLVPVLRERQVTIEHGENAGATLRYVNVARGLTELGVYSGAALRLPVPAEALKGEAGDAEGFVVLLQRKEGKKLGAIMGVATSAGF
jgi:hypothetical protein